MNPEIACRPLEVLLVEDDLEDAEMTLQSLGEGSLPCHVSLVRDGDEALRFLRREGPMLDAPVPDVVLLDMQMPRMDGREVLAEVRRDARVQALPVIVMTGSRVQRAILEGEQLRVDGYLSKPVSGEQFAALVRAIRARRDA